MRNLKKILALVLALMMTVSLMVVASAASIDDYSDKEQIDETYAVAVEVLAGIGMYQGDTEGTFRPQENLSRAEVATLLYRLTTGDYDGSKVDTYAGYDEFTDVSKDQWYAGYVNYAYVEGYVIGNGDGTFSPENNVTGAELATMLLRVLGRDAEGEEISGDDWALDASVLAAKLGLNENLPSVFMSKDATREQTAQMIFNALQIETYWNWSGNYRPTGDTLIGLKSTRGRDIWGRPGDQWSTNSGNVAFLEDEPVAVYYTAETECDIATDLGAALKAGYKVYTNGASNESDDTINPLNRVSTLGEQGRRTGDKGGRKGGAREHLIAAPRPGCHDSHPRGSQIRLHLAGEAGVAASGKIRVGPVPAVVGPHGDRHGGGGRNGQGDLGIRL